MGDQRLVQVAEHRPALQPQRLHRRQDALHEPATLGTVAAERVLPPQHPPAQQPLRVVVRRLDAVGHHEPPHRRQQSQQVLAQRRRLGVRAAPPKI